MIRTLSFNPGNRPNPGKRHNNNNMLKRLAIGASLAAISQMSSPQHAHAKKKAAPPPPPQFGKDVVVPMVTNGGVSALFGLAAGAALKMVGRVAVLGVGIVFCLTQLASQTGFIHVNWSKVNQNVSQILDVNKDGKVDANDWVAFKKNFLGFASQGVPSVGGFAAGFMTALQMF